METVAVQLAIDPKRVEAALQEARTVLEKEDGELILDLSLVPRLAARELRALEELAAAANGKPVKVVLRGTSSGLYKVLKLMKLSSRFVFAN